MTTDEVDYFMAFGVEEEAVDGEVAALGVALSGGECDVLGMAAIFVFAVGSEGGHFEFVAVFDDKDDAELDADRDGVGKESLDGFGTGIGGDVVVFWRLTQEHIPYASACKVGGVASFAEAADDVGGSGLHGIRIMAASSQELKDAARQGEISRIFDALTAAFLCFLRGELFKVRLQGNACVRRL